MNELLEVIDVICAPEEHGGLVGWCPPEKARWMATHVVREHLTHCVEIGVFGGRSLLALGLAVKFLGRGGYVLGIDPYSPEKQIEGMRDPGHRAWAPTIPFETIYLSALQEIRQRGLGAHCGILRAGSDECAGLIGPLDLLHIDGAHSVLASCRDVEVWTPKVRSGGLIVLDDADWPMIQPARAMLASQCEAPVSLVPGWEAYRKR